MEGPIGRYARASEDYTGTTSVAHVLGARVANTNLYSITTNQAAITALFRVVNRYVGNLAPMPGVFPDDPQH